MADPRRHPSFNTYIDSYAMDTHDQGSNPRVPQPSKASTRWTSSSQQNPHKTQPLEPVLTTTSATVGTVTQAEAHDQPEDVERRDLTISLHSSYFDFNIESLQVDTNERKEGRRNFVGGFVDSLKRLPKAMKTSGALRLNTVDSNQTAGSGATNSAVATPLPIYDAETVAIDSDIAFVEAMNMPVEPAQVSVTHHPESTLPYDARSSDIHAYDISTHDSHNYGTFSFDFQNHDTLSQQSAIPPARQIMMSHSESGVIHHNMNYDVDTLDVPYGAPASGVCLSNSSSPNSGSPLNPPLDSTQTESSIQTRSEPSSPSRLGVRKFFKSLYRLPWVSSRMTSAYVPRKRSDGRSHEENLAASWYFHPRQSLDLFSSGDTVLASPTIEAERPDRNRLVQTTPTKPVEPHLAPPGSRQRHRQRTTSDVTSSHTRRNHTRGCDSPTILHAHAHRHRHARGVRTSSAAPGSHHDSRRHRIRTASESSHRSPGLGSRRLPLYPHGYSPFPYAPLPQPLFVLTPPSQPSSVNGHSEMHRAVPLYMIAPSSPRTASPPSIPDHMPEPEINGKPVLRPMSMPTARSRAGQMP